jgi:hypothetical protein
MLVEARLWGDLRELPPNHTSFRLMSCVIRHRDHFWSVPDAPRASRDVAHLFARSNAVESARNPQARAAEHGRVWTRPERCGERVASQTQIWSRGRVSKERWSLTRNSCRTLAVKGCVHT